MVRKTFAARPHSARWRKCCRKLAATSPMWVLRTFVVLASPKSGLKGRTCAVAGRKVTGMFNSRTACISLTPQLHTSYAHAESADCTERFLMKQFRGHRVLAASAMAPATNCSILLSEIIAVHGVLQNLLLDEGGSKTVSSLDRFSTLPIFS